MRAGSPSGRNHSPNARPHRLAPAWDEARPWASGPRRGAAGCSSVGLFGPYDDLIYCLRACSAGRAHFCMPTDVHGSPRGSTGLVDVLDRVLDKGLVVAGDIKVSLAEVELLTIRIRLMICSIDKAEQIGLDWWKYDRHLSPGNGKMLQENSELREQLRLLEARVANLTRTSGRNRRDALTFLRERRRWPLNEQRAAPVLSTCSTGYWTRASSSTRGCGCPSSASTCITVEARVVVASIDTYLKYSEAVGGAAAAARPALDAPRPYEELAAENVALRAQLESGSAKTPRSRGTPTSRPPVGDDGRGAEPPCAGRIPHGRHGMTPLQRRGRWRVPSIHPSAMPRGSSCSSASSIITTISRAA